MAHSTQLLDLHSIIQGFLLTNVHKIHLKYFQFHIINFKYLIHFTKRFLMNFSSNKKVIQNHQQDL